MLQLLCNMGFVRRTVQHIPSPTEFLHVVIFEG